ncbi:MAG TPA: aminotransferase class I/II-fold pyridoxal phosphate-dependent enzyme, partial [Vampirovibrionales bacterium]
LPHSFNRLFKYDLSEVTGLDDLHNPDGLLKEALNATAEMFQVEQSFFSVNGASACLSAACLALGQGGKVLVPQNAHKSVLSGLILSGATPVYYQPEWDAEWGVFKGVNPESIKALLEKHEHIKGCFVTSPTYEGFATSIGKIVELCHAKEIPVIVDESHGGHLSLLGDGQGAINGGADLVIHSAHKSLGALTQTGLLHFQSELINPKRIEASLSLLQSTSPSFLLLTSLVEALKSLSKDVGPLIKQALNAREIKAELQKIAAVEVLENDAPSRVVVSVNGWTGEDLSEWLYANYKIETELEGNKWVLLLIGLENKVTKFKSIVKAFKKAAERKLTNYSTFDLLEAPALITQAENPRSKFFKDTEPKIEFKCPPGIPDEILKLREKFAVKPKEESQEDLEDDDLDEDLDEDEGDTLESLLAEKPTKKTEEAENGKKEDAAPKVQDLKALFHSKKSSKEKNDDKYLEFIDDDIYADDDFADEGAMSY